MLFFIATEFIACHRSIYFLSGTFGVIIFIYVPQTGILSRKGLSLPSKIYEACVLMLCKFVCWYLLFIVTIILDDGMYGEWN